MKLFKDLPFHKRMVLFVLPVVFFGVVLIALINVRSVIDYRLHEAYLDAKAGAALTLNNIEHQKHAIEKTIASVGDSLQTFQGSHKELQSLLSNMVLSNPELTGASFVITKSYRDLTHVPLCKQRDLYKPIQWPANCYFADQYSQVGDKLKYLDLTSLEPDYSESKGYKLAVNLKNLDQEKEWTRLYPSIAHKEDLFTYVATIETNIKGKKVIMAYLMADLELGKVLPMISKETKGEDTFVQLINSDNEVYIDSHDRRKYLLEESLSSLPKSARQEFLSRIAKGELFQVQLPCLSGKTQCYYIYSPVGNQGLGFLFTYNLEDIYYGVQAFALQYIVLSTLLLLASLLVLWYLCKRATTPLVGLSEAAAQIGEGHFQQPLPAAKYNDEVGQLVMAFRTMQTALATHTEQLNKETAKRHRLEGEMYAASVIQKAMLIDGGQVNFTSNQLSLWAEIKSARAIGGDFYHFEILDNKRLIFILGDVSDKGVPAALFMTRVLSIFRFEVHQHQTIVDTIQSMNDELMLRNDEFMFVTLICGSLSLETWQLDYISAGHDAPLLMQKDSVAMLKGDISPALGLRKVDTFALNSFTMKEGDKLVLYTDGISEAFNEEDEIYGVDRLVKVLDNAKEESANIVGENILKSVQGFSGQSARCDDMAIMVIGIEPVYNFLIPVASESFETYHFRYDASMEEVKRCLEDTARIAKMFKVENKLYGMQLVSEEILMNWIQYADHEPKSKIEFIWLNSIDNVILEVVDSSSAFNPLETTASSKSPGEIGGLGLQFIRSVTQEQRYLRENDKNRLCLTFN